MGIPYSARRFPALYASPHSDYDGYMRKEETSSYAKWTDPLAPITEQCAAFDLDDTLASYCKDRGLRACAEFTPLPLLTAALAYQRAGVTLVLASARPAWCFGRTLAWCRKHGIRPASIYLKGPEFAGTAHDLKHRMLRDIMQQHQIVSFYDDSPFNCIVAKDLGIPTCYVPGNESYWMPRGVKEGWFTDRDVFDELGVRPVVA